MKKFSHLDEKNKAKMVNVGAKPVQKRLARASGKIFLAQNTLKAIQKQELAKGDVLAVAKIAGIQAAKKTSELIPLCHTLLLDNVEVNFRIDSTGITAESIVQSRGVTGVEMEALTAVSVALLTVYDMCKAVDKNMRIGEIILLEKTKQ
ncbi:MAG: cyclic pyranopterin monophosphate synthase MoaC [Gammaproteobacteria bacterium]